MVRIRVLIVLIFLAFTACSLNPEKGGVAQPDAPPPLTLQGLIAAKRGQPKEAVRLFSEALAAENLTPDERSTILNNRGVALKNLSQYEDAVADFSQAIALRNGLPTKAFHNRAMALFFLGRFPEAAADFEIFIDQNPKMGSPYPHLWLYLARERAGLNGVEALTHQAALLKAFPWPGPMAELHLDRYKPETLLEKIPDDSPQQKRENDCDAFFHLGEYHLLKGDKAQAKAWFRKALATGMVHLNEYNGAATELARLSDSLTTVVAKNPGGDPLSLPAPALSAPATRELDIADRVLASHGKTSRKRVATGQSSPKANKPVTVAQLFPQPPREKTIPRGVGKNAAYRDLKTQNRTVVVPAIAAPDKGGATQSSLRFDLEVGYFREMESVEVVTSKLKKLALPVRMTPVKVRGQPMYRLRIGTFATQQEAEQAKQRVLAQGGLTPGRILYRDYSQGKKPKSNRWIPVLTKKQTTTSTLSGVSHGG